MRDTISFRQQLSTTSFEAFFCVHLNKEWQFHAKSNELTDAFLACPATEHKVLHCYELNAVYRCLVAGQLVPRLADSLQHTVDASQFPTLVGQFTECSPCTILLCQIEILIRMTSSYEIFMILFNFCWYVGLDNSQGKVAALNRWGGNIKTPVDGL